MIPPTSKIIDNNEASYRSNHNRNRNVLGLNMVGGSSSASQKNNNNNSNNIINNNNNVFINQMNRMKCKYNFNDFDASHATKAFGPIAIIGGTVSIYTAALSHTSTTLTPLSVFYLLLLALNYSIMPRITKKYVSPKVNKESVALVEEVVKLSMGVGGFLLTECISPSSSSLSSSLLLSSSSSSSSLSSSILGLGMGLGSSLNNNSPAQILSTCSTNIQNTLSNWSIQSSLLAAGLPSTLYAIQGVLTYTSYQNLDSVTFNGLTQFKTLSAALCCYIVLGKVQSPIQILALALLSVSTAVFQFQGKSMAVVVDAVWMRYRRWMSGSGSGSGTSSISSNSKEKKRDSSSSSGSTGVTLTTVDGKKRFLLGIVPCLGATLLSGLAGAFSQRSLQTVVGSMERNAYFYSAEISFFSALCLLISMATKKLTNSSSSLSSTTKRDVDDDNVSSKKDVVLRVGYFDHWTWQTFIPIIVKATGGILTALVHKHSGSVMKGFSLVLGLVFSALLQTVLDGKDLTFGQMVGTALVLLSSWLHFTNPSST